MAEVKLKNGYLKISNSLYDNLYFRNFTKRELVIISLVVRLSYGFNHKTAIIKPKTWFSVAGLYKSDINDTLNGLIAKRVIISHGNNVYSLNKNYDEWLVNYPKNFDDRKFTLLKSAQFSSKQNTNESVSEGGLLFKNYDHKIQNVEECRPNDFIIMFFTGMYDKHKKPIYEDDILKDKSGHIRICVKEDGAYKFPALKESRYFHYPIKNKRPDRRNGLLAFLTFQDQLSRKDKAELEVIGNIYENKELIGG